MAKPKRALCNDKAFTEAMVETGESMKLIQQVINHHMAFVAQKISEGGFESVRIAGFGIFKANLEAVFRKNNRLPKYTERKPLKEK